MDLKQEQSLRLEQELLSCCLCDFCKEREATLTMDTPKNKNVPLCNSCFKKINVIAGVMKGKGVMNINEVWDEVKDVDNNNWRDKALPEEVQNR